MKTVIVIRGNIHFHNSYWLHWEIIDQSTCTLCCSHQKWHCAFTLRSTEWGDHSSSHITIALNLWPQCVPRSKPFPFCFWLLANPQSWFVAGSPLVHCSILSGVISLWMLEKRLNWGNWPLPVAAHVGVIRVEGRCQGDQAEQVEPQQDLGGNPAGPHCPLACPWGSRATQWGTRFHLQKAVELCARIRKKPCKDYYCPKTEIWKTEKLCYEGENKT